MKQGTRAAGTTVGFLLEFVMASKRAIKRRVNRIAISCCDGKIKHANKWAAAVACKKTQQTYKIKFNYYKCFVCGFWHVGHRQEKGLAVKGF